MINLENINIKDNEILYKDVDKCLEFCSTIPQSADNPRFLNFYSLWYVGKEFERKQTLILKSYLATQDLNNSSFTLYSNKDLTNNEFFAPFKDHIRTKIYDPTEESKGTVLENFKYINHNDKYSWGVSDLFRILIGYKYGGIYLDMDTALMRDFAPLSNIEFCYNWSYHLGEQSNACMNIFNGSDFSKALISTLAEISPSKNF